MTEFTIGVEEEYQLIDPATGDLRSAARAVLQADWTGEIRHEMQESQIEIGTRVCADGAALKHEMVRLRSQAAAVAASRDLTIVAAGLHPYSRWEDHEMSAGDRYQRIAAEYGRIALEEHNFGMHVHVAVPDTHDRVRLMGAVRNYLPHLLALACSSPVYEGSDTAYASYRSVLWRRWPRTGIPPRFADDAEYDAYISAMRDAAFIQDARDVYWMVRPHPRYPTLEFRACDVCPALTDALAITSLIRVIVYAAVCEQLQDNGVMAEIAEPLLHEDAWRATRFGLDATFARPGTEPGWRDARTEIYDLIARLSPLADDLGEDQMVEGIERILTRGNGADRIRARLAEVSDVNALPLWLAAETAVGIGIDRRRDLRADSVLNNVP